MTNSVTQDMMANAIRALAIDGVEAAKSGHPGMPMGAADMATALFTRVMKFDAAYPHWPDRDRFVLSAGHGSMLLYALLYLTGYPDLSIDDLKKFRQVGSKTPGHPEYGHTIGVETTTGPLGQGIATAVGMALAERHLAAEFGGDIVDHHTYVICGDGDLMEGVSQEAIAFAGHLKLSRLIVLYDELHRVAGVQLLARNPDAVLVDSTGMMFQSPGTGTYNIRRSLISRVGIGAEFLSSGHTLRIEDTWWSGIGRGPSTPIRYDGDAIHVDGAGSNQMIRGNVIVDVGDDCIDHSNSTFTIENTMIHNCNDKAVSLTNGSITVRNSLIYDAGTGIRGTARVSNSTISAPSPIATVESLQESIVWPQSVPTCTGAVNYSIVGAAAGLGCGMGNRSVDPRFANVGQCTYNPAAGSPAQSRDDRVQLSWNPTLLASGSGFRTARYPSSQASESQERPSASSWAAKSSRACWQAGPSDSPNSAVTRSVARYSDSSSSGRTVAKYRCRVCSSGGTGR